MINDSTVRLLRTPGSTRSQKSWKSVNGPPASRSSMSCADTPSPTLRTAERPNRIALPSHEKSLYDAFTSGTSTGTSSWRHSPRYTAALSRFVFTLVSSAAKYCTGKFAFNHAVWYET